MDCEQKWIILPEQNVINKLTSLIWFVDGAGRWTLKVSANKIILRVFWLEPGLKSTMEDL